MNPKLLIEVKGARREKKLKRIAEDVSNIKGLYFDGRKDKTIKQVWDIDGKYH